MLSIVGLVVVIRIILIPLFVKQIKAQRALQMLQPQIKELQKRYKDDRQKQSEELMKLYRENRDQPVLVVSADHLADADLLCALPRAELRRGQRQIPIGADDPAAG